MRPDGWCPADDQASEGEEEEEEEEEESDDEEGNDGETGHWQARTRRRGRGRRTAAGHRQQRHLTINHSQAKDDPVETLFRHLNLDHASAGLGED